MKMINLQENYEKDYQDDPPIQSYVGCCTTARNDYVDLIRALNNAAIITETDLHGTITSVNAEFCRISGYSKEELVGQKHNIVNSGVHTKEFFELMWTTICGGGVWFGEVCNRAKDGSLYWLHATIFPIFSTETNEVYKYAAIRFDITEKKKQEFALKHKAEQYRDIIDITDGFCRVDADGRFLEVSNGYCQITGYSEEELLSMNICGSDNFEGSMSRILEPEFLMGRVSKSFETICSRKNGSKWNAEINVSHSTLNDGSFFILFHNISERKEIEANNENLRQQVNQIQKLDSIGRLTAGIAHDFNNVLASILGYNEFNKDICDDMPDGALKVELRNNVIQVETAAKRAVELINKMMTYARQKTNKKSKDTKPTAEIIEEVVNMLRSGLTNKFAIELDLNYKLHIDVDSTDMHQIMTNLLVNARDAMKNKKHGVIKIQLHNSHYDNAHCNACFKTISGEFIELSVSDNGMGIDKELQSSIFDPFFTTKDVGEGTGLGLSVVNGIVRNAGGHILIDSQRGVGTTFKLVFPLQTE